MSCRVETDPARGLTAVRAGGEIDVEEVLAAIRGVWRERAYQAHPWVLWDLRNASLKRLHGPQVREIVELERAARTDTRRARLAFLVASDVGFGMARMMAALLDREPIDVEVFRDEETAAWTWLTEPERLDAPS